MCQRVARIYFKDHKNCFRGNEHSSLIFRISRYRSIPWLPFPALFLIANKSVQTKGDSRGIPLAIYFTTAVAVGFTVMSWYTNKRSRTYSGNSSPDKEFRSVPP